MSAVIWGLSPHPPLLVPAVGGENLQRVHRTREALEGFCEEVRRRGPESLVLVTPHGPVHPRAVTLLLGDELRGSFSRFGAPEVELRIPVDRALARAVQEQAQALGIPILPLEEETARRHRVPHGLDHALMVPLWYLRQAGVEVPIVALSISGLPRQEHFRLGRALRQAVRDSRRPVAVVASGDLSHRLLESGPYGFDEMGPLFDQRVVECLERLDVEGILGLPEDLVRRAGECGLRPLVTLLGSLEPGARSRVHSYEGPFGVGYAVVQFDPASEEARLELAREAVEGYVRHRRPPEVPPALLEACPELRQPAGVFVCLKMLGRLRGCIGTVTPTRSCQAEEIMHNAVSACSRDPRFPPVRAEELPFLAYSVDVLQPAEPVSSLEDLDPAVYGLVVRRGQRSGVLLPAIPGVTTARMQLEIACKKAGISPDGELEMMRFLVTRYAQTDLGAPA
ncbi:MAG TPA: AmmeMemoRadiSam system protein A [Candidatus Nitrosotenuis sp.]|nr:AmmeMemoRadiSam system protein A [Candidatus Nitrosotenuis sp.]